MKTKQNGGWLRYFIFGGLILILLLLWLSTFSKSA